MARLIADTDVLIDALNSRGPAVGQVRAGIEAQTLLTTAVSRFELLSGVRTREQERAILVLLEAIDVLPLDDAAATHAARVRLALEESGRPIGMADYWIAGVCLSRSLPLLTRNRQHFGRVAGLELG